MPETIFYSWQSDVPSNKRLIGNALERAVMELRKDQSLVVDVCVDRAMKGAAGAPRIDEDILSRIDQCVGFVADVTLVTAADSAGRRSPNPNVVLELGYAVKVLGGWESIVLCFNTAFGSEQELPFDLEKHRLLKFEFHANKDHDESRSLSSLAGDLRIAIETILRRPTLKQKLTAFFDSVNPEVLRHVRSGANQLSVQICEHRIGDLGRLKSSRGFDTLLSATPNHNSTMSGGRIGGAVHDIGDGGTTGYDLFFNDTTIW